MLYDVMPPLVFLGSLGGIIVVLARIIGRMHRAKLAVTMNAVAAAPAPSAAATLQPPQSSIRLIGSRLGLFQSTLKNAGGAARTTGRFLQTHLRPRKWFSGVTWPARQNEAITAPVISKVQPPRSRIRLRKVNDPARDEPTIQTEAEQRFGTKKVFSPAFFKKVPTTTQLEAAQAALNAAHYEQAEEILVPYIFKHSKDTTAYMLLGQAAMGQQKWNEAVEIFEQVVAHNTNEPGAYAKLGAAAYRAGEFAKALPALQRARDHEPDNREVLECLLAIARKMDNQALQHSLEEKMAGLKLESNQKVTA